MKINLKYVLKNFNDQPVKTAEGTDLTLGEALSEILLKTTTGGKMKMFLLAERCYKEGEVDFDATDSELITQAVNSQTYYLTLVAGQIEKILSEIKEGDKK